MKKNINWEFIKGYFRLMADKEDEQEIIKSITKDVRFHGANLWVLIFAIFIASLGLNINSTAVIIGAMLISPLMGPIIGMGLAIGINDFELLKKSFKNYFIAVIISVVTATFYFFISPFSEAQSELLARTSPTLYDVLIAFFGGAAGIVAICTKGKGNVLPGVAIATALMPPLCTAGYGLATGHLVYFFSAFYLFFINTVFICLATYLGVRMLNFEYKKIVNKERYKKVHRYIGIIVVLTMIPAGIITFNIIRNSIFKTNVSQFIESELDKNGTRIIDHDIIKNSHSLRVVAVGKIISDNDIKKIQSNMNNYNLGGYSLQIIQGSQSDSIMLLNNKVNTMSVTKNNYTRLVQEQSDEIQSLQKKLGNYTQYEEISIKLRDQIKVLFPQINTFGLSSFVQASTDTTDNVRYTIAIIELKKKEKFTSQEFTKLRNWLSTYINSDSIRIITTSNH